MLKQKVLKSNIFILYYYLLQELLLRSSEKGYLPFVEYLFSFDMENKKMQKDTSLNVNYLGKVRTLFHRYNFFYFPRYYSILLIDESTQIS